MKVEYLPFIKQYIAKYQGKTLGTGKSHAEAIAHAVEIIKNLNDKYIWKNH